VFVGVGEGEGEGEGDGEAMISKTSAGRLPEKKLEER
jgi:hypothetical protein